MKTIIQLIALCFMPLQINAQWTEPVSGVIADLNDVHFPTSTIGFAVGQNGTLIKSVDAGDSWTVLSSGSTSTFEGVHFIDANTGLIVGHNIMLRTTDGGSNWSTVSLPVSEVFMDVEFTDATTGYCIGAGGTLLKTIDAGLTWIVKNSDCTRYLSKIQFPTPSVGYATSKGYNSNFIKTTDGGETWFNDTIDASLIYGNLESVYFIDENTGLIGSWYIYGLIKTTDGGLNWMDVSGSENPDLYSIDFANGSIGFAGGINGLVMTTTDAGDTWSSENISGNVLALQALSTTDLICVGYGGYIAKKANATSNIDSENKITLNVFPNPSNGNFNIITNSNENKDVKLFSADGKLIQSFNTSDNKIELEILNGNGLYFLEISNEFGNELLKLVVE